MDSGKQLDSEAAGRRPRRSEAFWREAIDRQRDSGLTQQGFCDREGLPWLDSAERFARGSTYMHNLRLA